MPKSKLTTNNIAKNIYQNSPIKLCNNNSHPSYLFYPQWNNYTTYWRILTLNFIDINIIKNYNKFIGYNKIYWRK